MQQACTNLPIWWPKPLRFFGCHVDESQRIRPDGASGILQVQWPIVMSTVRRSTKSERQRWIAEAYNLEKKDLIWSGHHRGSIFKLYISLKTSFDSYNFCDQGPYFRHWQDPAMFAKRIPGLAITGMRECPIFPPSNHNRGILSLGRNSGNRNINIFNCFSSIPLSPYPTLFSHLDQGSLLFPKIEFFIKGDIWGWSFL